MSVLESASFIAQNSKHVHIPMDNIDRAARFTLDNMKAKQYSTHTWNEHPLQPKELNASTVDWIFLVDVLNFSFWSDLDDGCKENSERYTVKYKGKLYTGYWSLCAAINRALDAGIPITSPAYYANASAQDIAKVFASETKESIPLFKERVDVIHEAGKVLLERFDGSFVNCIRQANSSADALLRILVDNFSSFRDIHMYQGRQVYILKRAQILIADIWACFDGQSYGKFHDIDRITMFADYRVPQALCYLGVLEYSKELLDKLNTRQLIESGSDDEIEIRGNSIWAVELMIRRIKEIAPDQPINAILVDFYIWDTAKEIQEQMNIPIHRTRSIYY
ncbi:hypothetical protein LRAMOSA07508 [Lichtheimia ramosa]|uniref:Queuosine 5'-phosphate N-glycosylase/hydrolase n=1 Tax=Lichtheimia ramosa TaxID=688394 RepID=A0A077WD47_9FUNG|nr:hypothetical protein LRAMOSA07508 [Lichtheimia ramosa]